MGGYKVKVVDIDNYQHATFYIMGNMYRNVDNFCINMYNECILGKIVEKL